MPKGAQRIHTHVDEHEAQLSHAAFDKVPDAETALRRRDAAVTRMLDARAALLAEIAGVSGIETTRDDQWSVMHVLAHVGKDSGGHFSHVYDVIDRGITEIEPFESRGERLHSATQAAVGQIDAAIAFAGGLTPDELLRCARKSGRDHYVLGFVEAAAAHLEQHVAQLREMKRGLAEARDERVARSPG